MIILQKTALKLDKKLESSLWNSAFVGPFPLSKIVDRLLFIIGVSQNVI
jgi:hypothetical protein